MLCGKDRYLLKSIKEKKNKLGRELEKTFRRHIESGPITPKQWVGGRDPSSRCEEQQLLNACLLCF